MEFIIKRIFANRKNNLKNLFYLIVLICFLPLNQINSQPENPGDFKAGWINFSLNRDGRLFSAVVYYPALSEGSGAPINYTDGPYPIIAFGHGFAMQTSYYQSLFKHLASHGFVVIAPQFPDVSHLQLAYDLIYCLNYIKSQNSNSQSMFYNLLNIEKCGLSGHSMGGGASLLASSIDSTIIVVAPLAAAETNPSAINSMSKIKSVVYLISAQSDGITPPSTNQIPMYNNSNPIKAIPIIKGANHTKFMDTRIWDWTDLRGYLSAAEQLRITRRYLTSIFKLFLYEDTLYFKYAFGEEVQNDTSIILQYELKPLIPKHFNLISPIDDIVLFQDSILFQWEKTFSLNLFDTIRYRLIISKDSLFTLIYKSFDSLQTITKKLLIYDTGKFYWKVVAYTSDTTFVESNLGSFNLIVTKEENESKLLPDFELKQNYPNPFNQRTKITFKLSEQGQTSLKVFDSLGREIKSIVEGNLKPNLVYEFEFDGQEFSGGVYLIQLRQANRIQTKKMVLLK